MSMECKIKQCHLCNERCPQAEMADEIAHGRMYATTELIACQKELEEYRAIGTPEECRNNVLGILKAYNKGIDDLVERLKDYFVIPHDVMVIEQFAKQLKKGEEND